MKYLLGLLIVFEITDGLLTHFLVGNGLAREANPFLLPLVGETNFLIIKVVGVLVCALILWDVHKRFPKVAVFFTSFFVLFYALVVVWNLAVFFSAQRFF